MKIRLPGHVQPTYANFCVIDWKRGEIVLNLCFAEGNEHSPTATVVHKVVVQPADFERMVQRGQDVMRQYVLKYTDA